jgi:hypothetical protein
MNGTNDEQSFVPKKLLRDVRTSLCVGTMECTKPIVFLLTPLLKGVAVSTQEQPDYERWQEVNR